MMLPPRPCRRICAPVSRATRNMPSRFTAMTRRHSSREYSSNGAKKASRSSDLLAALLCRMSMAPKRSTVRPTSARTAASSRTSQDTPSVATPQARSSSSAKARTGSSCRSATTTFAPKSASPRQKRRPRIPTAPVTMAVRPVRSKSAR